jgi:hypothetical protein
MNYLQKYPFLRKLLSPFRLSQQKTCAEILVALCEAGAANSFLIAGRMSSTGKLQLPSAVNKFYRFLRNPRFDDWLLSEQLFSLFAERRRIVLSLDWTAWHDRFSLLVASVSVDKRAVPIAVSAVKKRFLTRSQNLCEETFLRLATERLKSAEVKAIWLCDRGFRRVAWLRTLLELKQDFVVRLQSDVTVYLPDAEKKCLLSHIGLQPGEWIDLGAVDLRQDAAVRARVIGVWARESKDIWWLATNLKLSAQEIVALYDRRMSCEEQFRDSKGARFGARLKWTEFKHAAYLERMYLLVGVAMLLWTVIGATVEKKNPKVRLCSKKKGARISLLRIGVFYWQAAMKRVRLTMKFVKEQLPKPKFRYFQWLVVNQK